MFIKLCCKLQTLVVISICRNDGLMFPLSFAQKTAQNRTGASSCRRRNGRGIGDRGCRNIQGSPTRKSRRCSIRRNPAARTGSICRPAKRNARTASRRRIKTFLSTWASATGGSPLRTRRRLTIPVIGPVTGPPSYKTASPLATIFLRVKATLLFFQLFLDWCFAFVPGISMCDPIIDEHFRRSLGNDYLTLFSNNNVSKDASSCKPAAQKVTSNVIELMDNTGLSVDDHFAKALGDTWLKLNKKDGEIKSNGTDNQSVVSI